jgi:hypothetical protein
MQTYTLQVYRYNPSKHDTSSMLEWVKDQLDGLEVELINIMRWEDDGGRLVIVEGPGAKSSDLRRSI